MVRTKKGTQHKFSLSEAFRRTGSKSSQHFFLSIYRVLLMQQGKRNDHAKEKGKKRKGSQSESAIEEEGDCKQQLFFPFFPPPPPIPRYSWAVVTEPPTHPPILTDWVGGGTRMGTKMHFSNPPPLSCTVVRLLRGLDKTPFFPHAQRGIIKM